MRVISQQRWMTSRLNTAGSAATRVIWWRGSENHLEKSCRHPRRDACTHQSTKLTALEYERYLCHDVMWPDVGGRGDVLSLGALWLGGPEQSGAKHSGQVMEGHLVDGLLLSHPAGIKWRQSHQSGRMEWTHGPRSSRSLNMNWNSSWELLWGCKNGVQLIFWHLKLGTAHS